MNTKYNDFKTYTVSGNETVQDICLANNISESDLVQANPHISLASYGGSLFSSQKYKLDIKPGDVLNIPFYNEEKDKKGVKIIKGKSTVKVGVWEDYEVTDWYEGTPEEDRNEEKVKWDLYYMQNGTKPELILQKEEGKIRFQDKAVGNKYKVVAYLDEPNLNDGSALLIEVEASEKKEILSIKISDSNNKPINGPLAYGEKINVHVTTTGMKGEYIYITLWEDDANGEGHDEANKYNQVGVKEKALVGEKGVAHAIFTLNPDFKKIANAHLSKGDSNEGKTHEYYAIAHASGDSKASANFNIRNPDYKEKRKEEIQDHLKGSKPKPSAPDYKGPVKKEEPKPTQSSQVGISAIYIANDKGAKLTKSTFGNNIRVYIASKGLKNKKVRLWLYEKDTFDPNDELYSKDIVITSDLCYENIKLTKAMQNKGNEYEIGEGSSQELFARAKVMNVPSHIFSKSLQADISSIVVDVAESTTVAKVADSKTTKKESTNVCFCKQEENQFYWSDRLTCDQRKKVLEVCASIWGESKKKEKASELMSVMHLETANSFSPSSDNGAGYSGLIQFSDGAAKSIGTTRSQLKKMTFIEQMDYVKKYLEKKKGQLNTMTDLYLMVLKPNAVGQGNNSGYVLFDESISVPDGDGSKTSTEQRKKNIQVEPWVTKYGYASNPSFMTEPDEKTKRKKWVYTRQAYEQRAGFVNGKTTVGEVAKVLKNEHYNKGKGNIFRGECKNVKEEKKQQKGRAPWVDVAFEEFETYKGLTEKESPLKERISEYFKLSGSPSLKYTDAWCATFIFWCFQNTKDYKDTNVKGNVGAFDWAEKDNSKIKGNKSKDGWINGEKSEVFVGAIIVFSFSHVAIIVGENSAGDKYVYLGGNQGSKVTGGQKICLGTVSKTSKDIFAIMKPSNYKPKDEEKKLPKYDVDSENSNSSSR
ncbi:C40 family peptidase [Flavobacterium terrae]|uniref:LysM domain-containing protein n=1 Tax=Flavobacterium terrae TaxID=415425 RepID=A0A1M6F0V9_9FLAO|nr:LysM peptidoglycan-binding domain-containing protein [Flavobacterium terrae]SHI91374.1 hypothetical protein SAMN05444363_2077 [Flavobacterium terrae]